MSPEAQGAGKGRKSRLGQEKMQLHAKDRHGGEKGTGPARPSGGQRPGTR